MNKVLTKPLDVRVLSIDPGFTMMGVAFSILDYTNLQQHVEFCQTFKIGNEVKQYADSNLSQATNSLLNTHAVRELVKSLLKEYQPDIVICEAAYLNRFPQAFASLSLCLNAIETAVYYYDYDVGFYTFDPATIKVSMGVKGNNGDKDAMTAALLSNDRITSEVDLTTLDEHSVDSICIGHCYFRHTAEF